MAKLRSASATFLSVLVYYDEPQLMLLKITDDKLLIAVAVTEDEMEYPFFAAEVSSDQWARYRRGGVDLLYLFKNPKHKRWYLFDFTHLDEEDKVGLTPIMKEQIEPRLLPARGFFAREHTEPDTFDIAVQSPHKFLIDGAWDLPDFSVFYGRITNLYSFFFALDAVDDPNTRGDRKKTIRAAFTTYPWRGGSSYRHFYNDLLDAQDWSQRLSVKQIQYASPGQVEVNARDDVFEEVEEAIEHFADAKEQVTDAYTKLRSYLSKGDLLRASADKLSNEGAAAAYIYELTVSLCEELDFEHADEVFELVGQNRLAFAKVMLAYVRRLDQAQQFFAEGRVKFA